MGVFCHEPNIVEWDVSVGLVGERVGALYDQEMPILLAHRPSALRFLRLSRIVGAARALALTELGPDGPTQIDNSLVALADFKGDFCAVWHRSTHVAILESFIARAIDLEGEDASDQLGHEFDDALSITMRDYLSPTF